MPINDLNYDEHKSFDPKLGGFICCEGDTFEEIAVCFVKQLIDFNLFDNPEGYHTKLNLLIRYPLEYKVETVIKDLSSYLTGKWEETHIIRFRCQILKKETIPIK